MMNSDIKEISLITFGIYSDKEIKDMSVCNLDNPKKNGYGTVYDPRMGSTDSSEICETCKEDAEICPGHFGRIELNESIVHPLFYKRVINLLNCFCTKCYRLLLTKEQIYLREFTKYKGVLRFNKIVESLKKVDICCHENCNHEKPQIKFSVNDCSFSIVYEDKRKTSISIALSIEEIKKIFENISQEDMDLIGLPRCEPRNFIISTLPVLPPCARPYVKAAENICDDDLTLQYIEIIKANASLLLSENVDKKKDASESKRQRALATLRFRILTTFNNSQGKAKHTTNGRPLKSLKCRLSGKSGLIRANIMGKRCDQTGRTVIGPDSTLKMGQLAIPKEMADILTIPVNVNSVNLELLQKLVNSGKAEYIIIPEDPIKKTKLNKINLRRHRLGTRLQPQDVIIRGSSRIIVKDCRECLKSGDLLERNGKLIEKIKYSNTEFPIKIGWIVERRLQNGDYVLLNRQPTLHKASMMAMEIVIKPGSTLRMNLAITKPFNADFDGDEMNIHIPQSLEAQAELKILSAAQWNIISAQSSKPNMAIVQDSLLGAYRMTNDDSKTLSRGQFFDIVTKLDLDFDIIEKMNHVNKIFREKGKTINCYGGKGLFSLFLPVDLIYENENKANKLEPTVKIWRGVMYEGTLDKNILGASHNSLIQIIHKEYGPKKTSHFIDCVQFVTNNWLLIYGFSIGIKDCLISNEEKRQEIQDAITKCYIKAEVIEETTKHSEIAEIRINAAMGAARDVGLSIAQNALDKNNNFLSTTKSGSKGDNFNIAQITGALGQQNINGKRISKTLNNGRRSLPHYPFEIKDLKSKYSSKGFVESSFIKGLEPDEFYCHATAGRVGILDTAMGTAGAGYTQRRISKLTEDITVRPDGTVRDISGRMYQTAYGETGIDPTCCVKVGKSFEVCDISRMVNRLNMNHELNELSEVSKEEKETKVIKKEENKVISKVEKGETKVIKNEENKVIKKGSKVIPKEEIKKVKKVSFKKD